MQNRMLMFAALLFAICLFPLAGNAIGPLRAAAERQGSGACSPLWSGQHVGNREALSAQSLTARLAEGLAAHA